MKEKDKIKEKQKDSNVKWVIEAFTLTFVLSISISYISTNGVEKLNLFWAVFILILVIFLGILSDIIGIAVAVAEEDDFHAKASKKVEGSKSSLKLIKNAPKVSNICADVVGDICGVLSGALSTIIAFKIISNYGMPEILQYIISAFVASLTVSGKAIGKSVAKNNSTEIVHKVGIILNTFLKD